MNTQEINQQHFHINGFVTVVLHDGRIIHSDYPRAVWRWVQNKNWMSITVTDTDFDQSYGWDRI